MTDSGEITLETSEADHIGEYDLSWVILYDYYPSATFTGGQFVTTILPCVITEIDPPPVALDDIAFKIGIDNLDIVFESFPQSPLCEYDLDYYILIDGKDMAASLKISIIID